MLKRHALLFSLLLSVMASMAGASEDLISLQDPAQLKLYRELTAELRCPKCQNQNIADSNAVVAVDMRQKTLELVRQGQDREQVIHYMKERYGDFVHYQPPLQLSTIWLWLLPVFAVLALALTVVRRSKAGEALALDEQAAAQTEQAAAGNAPADSAVPDAGQSLEQELQKMIEQAAVRASQRSKD